MTMWFAYRVRYAPKGLPTETEQVQHFTVPLHVGELIECKARTYRITEIVHTIDAAPFVVAREGL